MIQKKKIYLLLVLFVFSVLSAGVGYQLFAATPELSSGDYNVVLNDVREILFYTENSNCYDYTNLKYKLRIYDVTAGKYCYLSSWRIPSGSSSYCPYTFDIENDNGRFKRGHTYNWKLRQQWDDTCDGDGSGSTDWYVAGSFIVSNNAVVQ